MDGRPDFSSTVLCQCQNTPEKRAKRNQWLLKYCRLPDDTEDRTFENFDTYTPDLKTALTAAQTFTPDGTHKCLVLMGKVDKGKSHLAIAVCRAWLKLEMPARYIFVPFLLDELRSAQNHEGDESYYRMMNLYQSVPLLVLDDIGAEKPTPWTQEKLTTIIHMRWEKGLHTMVTTNKALDQIPGDDEGRLGSRLRRYAGDNIYAIEDCGEYSLKVNR
jgi:DNA replication protein DnaC